jgi:hypothetical protein
VTADHELYKYVDAQNCQLVVKRAPSGAHMAVHADDLAIGGEHVDVWLPADEARNFAAAITERTEFECSDNMGDKLAMALPAEDWTVFTFTRAPREDDEEPATVRLVFLSARLPQLGRAITTVADQIDASLVKEV